MRTIRNRRGTEKPIEIFVALFVILAVALVMLKLFQGQITQEQKQLSDVQQAQKASDMLDSVTLNCKSLCTQASNNGCSLQSLATLCLASSDQVLQTGEYLDLDHNNMMNFNTKSFGGVGACEDKIYCFNGLIDQCCNQKITPTNCESILENFWKSEGLGCPEPQTTMFNNYLSHGACTPSGTEAPLAWWNLMPAFTCS